MSQRLVASLLGILPLVSLTACGASTPKCVSGASATCACTDGQQGAQVCQDNGKFGPCECAGRSGDAGPDVTSGPPDAKGLPDGDGKASLPEVAQPDLPLVSDVRPRDSPIPDEPSDAMADHPSSATASDAFGAGVPAEGSPCDRTTFKRYCSDSRFLIMCNASNVIQYYDCYHLLGAPSVSTYETCQSGVMSNGQLVDRCQCVLGAYVCYPNTCTVSDCSNYAAAGIIDQCVLDIQHPGDTTAARQFLQLCTSPQACAPDWKGRTSTTPITCQ